MAETVLFPLLIALAALVLFLAAHLVVWQFESIKHRGVMLITFLSAVSYVCVAATAAFLGVPLGTHAWSSCPPFMLFVMLYLHFYVGIDRSVSVRMLGVLSRAEDGEMGLEEVEKSYPQAEMLRTRVGLLVEKGWLADVGDGKYRCTRKGRLLAKLSLLMNRLFLLETSG